MAGMVNRLTDSERASRAIFNPCADSRRRCLTSERMKVALDVCGEKMTGSAESVGQVSPGVNVPSPFTLVCRLYGRRARKLYWSATEPRRNT